MGCFSFPFRYLWCMVDLVLLWFHHVVALIHVRCNVVVEVVRSFHDHHSIVYINDLVCCFEVYFKVFGECLKRIPEQVGPV